MNYMLIIRTALGLAKQLQKDHPEIPGDDKFGMLLDLLIGIFGEADIGKYKAAVQTIVTLAIDGWKALNQFGFLKKKPTTAAATT